MQLRLHFVAFATSCPLASSWAKTIRQRGGSADAFGRSGDDGCFPLQFHGSLIVCCCIRKVFPYTRSDIPDKHGSKRKSAGKAPTAWPLSPSTGGRGVWPRRCRNIFSNKRKWIGKAGSAPNAVIGNGISLWPSLSSYGKTSFPIRCCANVTQSPAEPTAGSCADRPAGLSSKRDSARTDRALGEKQYG